MSQTTLHHSLPLTKEQEKAIKAYALLMQEIRLRADAMLMFAGADNSFPTPTGGEAAFLQLRLVCELIALGCLVAHGDLKEVREARLQKAYEADFIMKSLERLHTDFFPVPHTREDRPNLVPASNGHHFTPKSEGFLTKEALISLYRKTGSVLHRGSLKALFSNTRDEAHLIEEVVLAHGKITSLLTSHHVMTRDREFVILCEIPAEGEVFAAFASRMHPADCGCSNLVIF